MRSMCAAPVVELPNVVPWDLLVFWFWQMMDFLNILLCTSMLLKEAMDILKLPSAPINQGIVLSVLKLEVVQFFFWGVVMVQVYKAQNKYYAY